MPLDRDREYLDKTRGFLVKELKAHRSMIQDYISLLESPNFLDDYDVDNFMFLKKNLLCDIVDTMPIGADTCFFCVKYQDECDECLYAQMKGVCHESDSTYGKLQIAKHDLRECIEYYWLLDDYTTYVRLVNDYDIISDKNKVKEEEEEEKDNEYRPL